MKRLTEEEIKDYIEYAESVPQGDWESGSNGVFSISYNPESDQEFFTPVFSLERNPVTNRSTLEIGDHVLEFILLSYKKGKLLAQETLDLRDKVECMERILIAQTKEIRQLKGIKE